MKELFAKFWSESHSRNNKKINLKTLQKLQSHTRTSLISYKLLFWLWQLLSFPEWELMNLNMSLLPFTLSLSPLFSLFPSFFISPSLYLALSFSFSFFPLSFYLTISFSFLFSLSFSLFLTFSLSPSLPRFLSLCLEWVPMNPNVFFYLFAHKSVAVESPTKERELTVEWTPDTRTGNKQVFGTKWKWEVKIENRK